MVAVVGGGGEVRVEEGGLGGGDCDGGVGGWEGEVGAGFGYVEGGGRGERAEDVGEECGGAAEGFADDAVVPEDYVVAVVSDD